MNRCTIVGIIITSCAHAYAGTINICPDNVEVTPYVADYDDDGLITWLDTVYVLEHSNDPASDYAFVRDRIGKPPELIVQGVACRQLMGDLDANCKINSVDLLIAHDMLDDDRFFRNWVTIYQPWHRNTQDTDYDGTFDQLDLIRLIQRLWDWEASVTMLFPHDNFEIYKPYGIWNEEHGIITPLPQQNVSEPTDPLAVMLLLILSVLVGRMIHQEGTIR